MYGHYTGRPDHARVSPDFQFPKDLEDSTKTHIDPSSTTAILLATHNLKVSERSWQMAETAAAQDGETTDDDDDDNDDDDNLRQL